MTDEPEAKRGPVKFEPGKSGNPAGRPKGSRNKLGEAFTQALHDDFILHGKTAIETVRLEKPDQYLKVVASILPKQLEIKEGAFDAIGDEQLTALIAFATSALGIAEGSGSGDEDAAEPQPPEGVPTLQ
jgi:hypothetical protein